MAIQNQWYENDQELFDEIFWTNGSFQNNVLVMDLIMTLNSS